MKRRDIPNLLTFLRILAVGPIVFLLLVGEHTAALVVMAVAGATDGLDGYLAKRYGWVSRLGSYLDPAADKLLLLSVFGVLGYQSLLPLWLVGIVLARDLVIVLGFLCYYRLVGQVDSAPTLASKFNTLMQIVLGLLVIAGQELVSVPPDLEQALIVVVSGTTIASGAEYVWTWGQKAAFSRRDAQETSRRRDPDTD